jgi:hypothetical protein
VRIIGLTGRAGSGKSTCAAWLRDTCGAHVASFAAPLKEMAIRVYALTPGQVYGTQAEKERIDPRYGRSGRQLLQYLGTEVCRDLLGPDVWIRAAFARLERVDPLPSLVVFEDLRFPNEAQAIRDRGGEVIRLVCPDRDSSADGSHASEAFIDSIPADWEIVATRAAGPRALVSELARVVLS